VVLEIDGCPDRQYLDGDLLGLAWEDRRAYLDRSAAARGRGSSP
jgi:hypothetical protein